MWRGSLLVLALAQDEPWREDLGLHKTGQEQRRAAHWLADLDQAINFDLDTLPTDHALRRSQISQAGWTETHAKWLTRSQCAYQREGSTAPGAHVQTTMRDGANPMAQTVGIPRAATMRNEGEPHGLRATVHTTDELKLTRHRDNGDYDGDGVVDDLDVSIHPVCVGDVDVSSGGPCPDALCVSADAPWSGDVPSPYYRKMAVPPVLASHGVACKATNRRLTEENPVTGYAYDVDGTLLIRGIVRGPDGAPAKHALVEVWHADPYGRAPGGLTPLAEAHEERGTLPMDRYSLDGQGCQVVVRTNTEGRFSITTTAPGAYGPPQHFEMYVHNAEGFAPLYTKVYLGDDPHLRTLGKANVESLLRDRRVVVPQFSLKPTAAPTATPTFDTFAPTSTDAPTSTPTIDTGVARNAFDSQNATVSIDVVLQTAPASAKDFAGTWSDGLGLIRVASNGVRLLASEYPSPRTWGALGATHATAYTLSDATFRVSGAVTGELFKSATTDTIRWSSGDVWRRYDDAKVRRYRYLRISINETFRQRAGRIVEVDDIEIYGGVANHEDKVPPVPLEGRELPRPFRCWATTNTEDCFKAFDKTENAPWRSADVGGWAGALAQTQVLTLDVGDGHQLAPTCV
jgi:protocatechuate 3,4-dioxygenase beta subunit